MNQHFIPFENQQQREEHLKIKEPLHSTKTINVEVPEATYWHIRRCATESQMSMKEFMGQFCATAKPVPADQANSGNSESEPGERPKNA